MSDRWVIYYRYGQTGFCLCLQFYTDLSIYSYVVEDIESSVFRPIGVIGGGVMNPVALVCSVALLLVMLRYLSIRLIPSDQPNMREVPMKKTLTDRVRIVLSSAFESIWAIGVGSVVGHLSA